MTRRCNRSTVGSCYQSVMNELQRCILVVGMQALLFWTMIAVVAVVRVVSLGNARLQIPMKNLVNPVQCHHSIAARLVAMVQICVPLMHLQFVANAVESVH